MQIFLISAGLFFLLVNLLAWKQSGGMVKISYSGKRTSRPENLSKFQKILVLLKGVNLPCRPNEFNPSTHQLEYENCSFHGSQNLVACWYIPCANSTNVVILFHGYIRNKATLLNEASLLYSLGNSVLMIDFPGSGDSYGNHTTLGYYESLDVKNAIDFMKTKCPDKKRILYGFSMGAAAILRAVKLYPLDVDKIIMESPFTTLLETVGARFKAMGIPPYPLAHLLVFWGSIRLGYNGFTFNPIKYAKDITVPVLQLHGEDDRRVPLVRARALYENIRTEKTFVLFEGAGHESLATKDSKKWLDAISLFLGQQEEAKRPRNAA